MRIETRDRRWAGSCLFALGLLAVACTPPTPVPPVTTTPPVALPAPIERAPERLTLPRAGMVSGGAGPLQFRIEGTSGDTVLVPLASWLFPALAELRQRYVVVFYDPRHRGASHAMTDTTAATFDGDVADIDSVRKLVSASRVAIIGYDYYAAVAAAYASRHPQNVSRLVLLSPIEPADSLSRSWNPVERMARIDTVAARSLVKARAAGRDTSDAIGYCESFWRVNARLFVGDTARASVVRPDWCRSSNESPARLADAAGRAIASLGDRADFATQATGITAPTLVMHGRLDLVANPEGAREWTRRIPGARLLWLSNVGHLPFLEDGATVGDVITEFLSGRWPVRAGPP